MLFDPKSEDVEPIIRSFGRDPLDEEIGDGHFSSVYRGSRKTTVYKFTVDGASHAFMTEHRPWERNRLFPRLIKDYGQVGTINIAKEATPKPLYLLEIERLRPLSLDEPTHKNMVMDLMVHIQQVGIRMFGTTVYHQTPRPANITAAILREAQNDDSIEVRQRHAMREIADFILHYGTATSDFGFSNFMLRQRTGEVLFNDPVADTRLQDYEGLEQG